MSSTRKQFNIYYPKDHPDPTKAGNKYKPKNGNTAVMTNGGVFLLVSTDGWYQYVTKLSKEIGNYDVVWKE